MVDSKQMTCTFGWLIWNLTLVTTQTVTYFRQVTDLFHLKYIGLKSSRVA